MKACEYQERLVQDVNGFWLVEARTIPVLPWNSHNDGWAAIYISSIKEYAIQRMNPEFRKEYENGKG